MAMKKGLGRSFESLIPTDLLDESFDPTAGDDKTVSELRHIKLSEISADPDQPRRHFDEGALNELAASITIHGVLQPIVVLPKKGGGYEIVAGERRFRASQMAEQSTIPALVRSVSGQHRLELALIENVQRRDLNALETATAYAKLRDQFNMTLEQIGERVGGRSASAISNTLRLLRLPKEVQQAVAEGLLTEGQARPLVDLDESIIEAILPNILKEQLSARAVELLVRTYKPKNEKQQVAADKRTSYDAERKQIETRLRANVKVTTTARGAGQIVIRFKDQADFERLSRLL